MFVLFVLWLFKPHAVSSNHVRRLLVDYVLPKDEIHISKPLDYSIGGIAAALRRYSQHGLVAKRYAYGGAGLGTHVEWLITPDGAEFVVNACKEADQYWQDLLDSDVEVSSRTPFPSRYEWAGLDVMDLGLEGAFQEDAARIAKMSLREALRPRTTPGKEENGKHRQVAGHAVHGPA